MLSKHSNKKCPHASACLLETEESEEEDKENDKAEDDKENELTVEDKVRLLSLTPVLMEGCSIRPKCDADVLLKAHLCFI